MEINKINLADLRLDYKAKALDMADVVANPIEQFELWMAEAVAAGLHEPNAMTLATCTHEGKPSARIVLLKGLDDGFIFYTNYESRKGRELTENPSAALVFLWHELERQVRIEGKVERVSVEISTEYFQSRPKSSQIGAWASPQSQPLTDRKLLEENTKKLEAQYADIAALPLPTNWGGFRLLPEKIEFWQGRRSRLHDRLVYKRESAAQQWSIVRLAP